MKTCIIDGCIRSRRSAGPRGYGRMCNMHHMRLRKNGTLGPLESIKAPYGQGYTRKDGYREFQLGKRKRAFEHRLVWERIKGTIPVGYVIHHINGITSDNRIENLQCISRAAHTLLHKPRRTHVKHR